MKRFAMIMLAVFVFGFAAAAQNARSIYNKYSGKEGVSSVYISPSMFKLIKSIPNVEMGDTDVNMTNMIKKLDGFFLISMETPDQAKALARDVEQFIASGKYEQLMEAVEDGDVVRIYLVQKDNLVTDFLLYMVDDTEATFISISGELLFEDIAALAQGMM